MSAKLRWLPLLCLALAGCSQLENPGNVTAADKAALGGQLTLQSPRGEGTVLTVRVPLVAASTPLPPASLAPGGAA